MDHEAAAAIPDLVSRGLVPEAVAPRLLRAARRELVSIQTEIRVLLYGGVLLVVAGTGLLVRENLERIGPVVVAVAIGLAAAICLGWVWRTAPPFAWGEASSTHVAFDYLLLLGALLAAADLAYVEFKFTPLGASWPLHLLIVSLAYAALALRFDSRILFSLSLTTFAAWRGVSLHGLADGFATFDPRRGAAEAVLCGAAFAVLGTLLVRTQRKPHFEPTATHLGALFAAGGLAGLLGDARWALWALVMLAGGVALSIVAFHARRFWLFAIGVLAAYVALTRMVFASGIDFEAEVLWIAVSSLGLVVGLAALHRRSWRAP